MSGRSGETYRRELIEYLEVPLRRPFHVLIPAVLVTVAALGASAVLPKRYRTSTVILVESQKVPESFVRRDPGDAGKPRLLTIKQEILSRTRLEKVIRELDPYPHLGKASVSDLVETMRNATEISVRGNDAFIVEYEHTDPEMAMHVANRLAMLFIEESNQAREQQVEGAAEFIETQLEDARKKLEEKEQALRRFKESHMGRLPEQTAANLATLQRLQLEQQSVADSLRSVQERELVLEKTLSDQRGAAGAIVPGDPASELSRLRSELEALRTRYTEEHPDVQLLRSRIAEMERRMAKSPPLPMAPPSTVQAQLEQARLESRTLRAKRDELEKRIATFQGRVEEVPRTEQELAVLTRDYQKLNENYLTLLNKKLDAQMAERLEKRWQGERFRILDPAFRPERPIFPRRSVFLTAGALLGLLLGLAASFLAEYFDHSIKSLGELEATVPYPVIAAFPRIKPSKAGVPSRTPRPRPTARPPRASAGSGRRP